MKYISYYFDEKAVKNSAKFALLKLIKEPSYNFFNDPIEKQILGEAWKKLIAGLPYPADEASKLDRNRQKLAFKIFNFHIIIPENTILDEDYVFSNQYVEDYVKTTRWAYHMIYRYRKQMQIDEQSVNRSLENLFTLSCCTSVPIPRMKKSQHDKGITIVLRYLQHTLQIVPKSDEGKYNDETLQHMFSKFRIDKNSLQNTPTISNPFLEPPTDAQEYIDQYLLKPLNCISQIQLDYIEETWGKKLKTTYISCIVKAKGIFNAFENRYDKSNNTAFLYLADQVIYTNKNSSIGFAVDIDCVLMFDINVNARPNKIETIDEVAYEVPCSIRCFRFQESKINIFCLLMIILDDYFKCMGQSQVYCLDKLYKKLEVTESDISSNKKWRDEFVGLEWDSKHRNYHLNEKGDYVHNLYPSIIIPKRAYREVDFFEAVSYISTDLVAKSFGIRDFNILYFNDKQERWETKTSFLKSYSYFLTYLLFEIRIFRLIEDILTNNIIIYGTRISTTKPIPRIYGCAINIKGVWALFYLVNNKKNSSSNISKLPMENIHDNNSGLLYNGVKKEAYFVKEFLFDIRPFIRNLEYDYTRRKVIKLFADTMRPDSLSGDQSFKRRRIN
ncbi:uncharacterized protein RJT21DRAFT_114479 [Scheffersomyces amazonensis]|uniref:uncharacterized protein n=1 Tax=Scheffersomyces amazonensis TaxID=1078765 RepID=UPI00315C9544